MTSIVPSAGKHWSRVGFLFFVFLLLSGTGCTQRTLNVTVHFPASSALTEIQLRPVSSPEDCGWKDNDRTLTLPSLRQFTISSLTCPDDSLQDVKGWLCTVARNEKKETWTRLTPLTRESCQTGELHVFLAPHDEFSRWRVSKASSGNTSSPSVPGVLNLLGAKATPLENGEVVLTGGLAQPDFSGEVNTDKLTSAIQMFDLGTGRLRSRWKLSNPRAFHLQYQVDNQLVVCGGLREKKSPRIELWNWDAKGNWTTKVNPTLPPDAATDWVLLGAATVRFQEKGASYLLISGGVFVSVNDGHQAVGWYPNSRIWKIPTSDFAPCEPFSTDKNGLPAAPSRWMEVTKMTNARFGHTMTSLSGGRFLLVGGIQVSKAELRQARTLRLWLAWLTSTPASPATLELSGSSGKFSPMYIAGTDLLDRSFHTTTRVGKNTFLITGGVKDKRLTLEEESILLSIGSDGSLEINPVDSFTDKDFPARFFHLAIPLEYNAVYIMGGVRDDDAPAQGWLYLPNTGDWSRGWNAGNKPTPDDPPGPDANIPDGGLPDDNEPGEPDKDPPKPDEPVVPDLTPDKGIGPDTTPSDPLQSQGFLIGTNGIQAQRVEKRPAGVTQGFLFSAHYRPPVMDKNMMTGWFHGTTPLGRYISYDRTNNGYLPLFGSTDEKGDLKWMYYLDPNSFASNSLQSPLCFAIDSKTKQVFVAGSFFSGVPAGNTKETIVARLAPALPSMKKSPIQLKARKRGLHFFLLVFDMDGNLVRPVTLKGESYPIIRHAGDIPACKLANSSDCRGFVELVDLKVDSARKAVYLATNFRGIIQSTTSPVRSIQNKGKDPISGILRFTYDNGLGVSWGWFLQHEENAGQVTVNFATRVSTMTISPSGLVVLGGFFAGFTLLRQGRIGTSRLGGSEFPFLWSLEHTSGSVSLENATLIGSGTSSTGKIKGEVLKVTYIPGTSPAEYAMILRLSPNSLSLKYGRTVIGKSLYANEQLILATVKENTFSSLRFDLIKSRVVYLKEIKRVTCTFNKVPTLCLRVHDLLATRSHLYLSARTAGQAVAFDGSGKIVPSSKLGLQGFVMKMKKNLGDSAWLSNLYFPTQTKAPKSGSPDLNPLSAWDPKSLTVGYNQRVAILGTFLNVSWNVSSTNQLFLSPMTDKNSINPDSVLSAPQMFLWTQGSNTIMAP